MSVDENADMQDEATTAAFPIAPVKQEEDQYGDGEVSAPLQVKHDEDIGEAESEEQSDDKAESDYLSCYRHLILNSPSCLAFTPASFSS